MTIINPLDDVMKYYHYNFASVYCLGVIVVILTILCSGNKKGKGYCLLISTIAGAGLLQSKMFSGVLADNNAVGHQRWDGQLTLILVICFICWLLQLILLIRSYGQKRQPDKTIDKSN